MGEIATLRLSAPFSLRVKFPYPIQESGSLKCLINGASRPYLGEFSYPENCRDCRGNVVLGNAVGDVEIAFYPRAAENERRIKLFESLSAVVFVGQSAVVGTQNKYCVFQFTRLFYRLHNNAEPRVDAFE